MENRMRHKRSGYEPSDVESEESPWHAGLLTSDHRARIHIKEEKSPTNVSRSSPANRRHRRSPYKPNRDHNNVIGVSSETQRDSRRSISPLEVPRTLNRHVSPYKSPRHVSPYRNKKDDEHLKVLVRKQSQRTPSKQRNYAENVVDDRYRSKSVQKLRTRDQNEQHFNLNGVLEHRKGRSRTPPPPIKTSMILRNKDDDDDDIECREKPGIEINEVIANMKLSEAPPSDELLRESTESVLTGDIFFSKVQTALQKNPQVKKNNIENNLAPKLKVASEIKPKVNEILSSSLISNSKTSSVYTTSNQSSKWSTSGSSFKNFTANRQKNQTDGWIACIRGGSCRRSKSPEQKPLDEALFIEKAFVVEEVRQFWADKYRPRTLDGLICNRNQAQHLKNLISPKDCPNILLKGPSGSGKKSLAMAFLHEIFGNSTYKVSHDLRHFLVQDISPIQFSIPVSSSPHHLELDLKTESEKIRYALMAIVKETVTNRSLLAEVSDSSFKAEFKVLVLHGADKVTESVQHLIKWVMDCYSDACKIILCCENDTNILDSVKKRCKVITVTAPDNYTIVEVLNQVANKERIELPTSFAERIVSKSKKNLRHAIMALEACKAHNYPFVDKQPIPLGWEESLIELAAEILDDPSPQKLFTARAMFQRLLGEFVHPRLILLKLVEQFLKGIETSLKRELYYWHAYYDKRLPRGTNALLKLEEFTAKFLSISKRSMSLVNSAN
ncbi:uncharacterized protein LOC120280993 [Dioscorea cayenensis subsp. rotundata]|uniref:Uncharacterized protein LOC120280993 n=1 Tax=Dioscorea cayennensis subsp. rotundata TaxID=55577 RepID=A0AB40CZ80_DIOCR|nr:uncharacterized protein LOC120280993 [Dioscorea cayenensis subsp. rotundata]